MTILVLGTPVRFVLVGELAECEHAAEQLQKVHSFELQADLVDTLPADQPWPPIQWRIHVDGRWQATTRDVLDRLLSPRPVVVEALA